VGIKNSISCEVGSSPDDVENGYGSPPSGITVAVSANGYGDLLETETVPISVVGEDWSDVHPLMNPQKRINRNNLPE
jgi:hypothetical protein